jgi:spore germination protein GerM
MEDKNRVRRIPLGVLAGVATIVLASGGATAWFTWRNLNPKPATVEFPTIESTKPNPAMSTPPETAAPAETPTQTEAPAESSKEPVAQAPAADVTGQIYWLKDDGTSFQLAPETISVSASATPSEQVKVAFDQLLSKSGDPEQEAFTTIPEQTQLLNASVKDDGVHVDLSADFQYGGGSASMVGRLGQVVYTATAFDPDAPVWISVDGKPLTLLGGEGVEVSQPMTRSDFQQGFEL